MNKRIFPVIMLLIAICWWLRLAAGQVGQEARGSISGAVQDAHGSSQAGAIVTLDLANGNNKRTVITAKEAVMSDAGDQDLIEAIKLSDLAGVKKMLANGADPNTTENGLTALMLATDKDNIGMIKALLAAGAEVNPAPIKNGIARTDGTTPLMIGVMGGNLEIIQLLLQAGADVNAQTLKLNIQGRPHMGFAGETNALMMTVELMGVGLPYAQNEREFKIFMKFNLAIIKTLLAAGANVNAQDQNGSTALMYAAFSCNSEVIKILLRAGARTDLQDEDGKTALDYLKDSGRREDDPSRQAVESLLKSGQGSNRKK